MRRIVDHRKTFGITNQATLAELKSIYRNLMKEFHPDKFTENNAAKEQAEVKSKEIIEAYHFLVSISPETHATTIEDYTQTTTTSGINEFIYKGTTLKITFFDGSIYEFFSVQKNTYNKFISAPNIARFARRHIFDSHIYRNVIKANVAEPIAIVL